MKVIKVSDQREEKNPDCDSCIYYRRSRQGVPYGSTMAYFDTSECELDLDPEDCSFEKGEDDE